MPIFFSGARGERSKNGFAFVSAWLDLVALGQREQSLLPARLDQSHSLLTGLVDSRRSPRGGSSHRLRHDFRDAVLTTEHYLVQRCMPTLCLIHSEQPQK